MNRFSSSNNNNNNGRNESPLETAGFLSMDGVKFFLETEYDDLGYVKRVFVSPCLIFKVQDAVFGKLYTVIDTAGKRAVVDSVYDTYDDAFNALVSNMRYALEAYKAAERRL